MKRFTKLILMIITLCCLSPWVSHSSEHSAKEVTGIGKFLDLSQHGVSEEYGEYLTIGNKAAIKKAIKDGVNIATGVQEASGMVEGILYSYGLSERSKDLKWRIFYLGFLITSLLIIKRIKR